MNYPRQPGEDTHESWSPTASDPLQLGIDHVGNCSPEWVHALGLQLSTSGWGSRSGSCSALFYARPLNWTLQYLSFAEGLNSRAPKGWLDWHCHLGFKSVARIIFWPAPLWACHARLTPASFVRPGPGRWLHHWQRGRFQSSDGSCDPDHRLEGPSHLSLALLPTHRL
jgi:hypothetical protein